MRRSMRIAAALLCALLGLATFAQGEEAPYNSYTFDGWGDIVPAPNGYLPGEVYTGADLGTTALKAPSDLFVEPTAGELYIADTGNARVVVLDRDMRFVREYTAAGAVQLDKPVGVFVRANGDVFIADEGLATVVVCDRAGNLLASYGRPDSDLYDASMLYQPQKVVVDSVGRIYILSKGVYQGLICLNPDGTFLNYFGGNHVEETVKMMLQKLWRAVLTREQQAGRECFIPIEYSNIAIDGEDFIYACVAIGDQASGKFVRKLNPMGINILPNMTIGGLQLADVALGENGIITLLDRGVGLAIQMNEDEGGNMYNFGGLGNQTGLYKDPASIVEFGEEMLVLDRDKATISSFVLTEYGRIVREATRLYREGMYQESIGPWEAVLRMDANYQMAYAGLGKAYYQLEDYQSAMRYFRLGNLKAGYSQAFRAYSVEVVRRYLGWVLLAAVVLWAALLARRKLRRNAPKRAKRTLADRDATFPLYCMLHPFRGFEDLKFLGKGRRWTGFAVVALFFAASILSRQATGFIFNMNRLEKLNIPLLFAVTCGAFAVWYISSLAVSSLMKDCEGKSHELFLVPAYALVPAVLGMVVATLVSNFITIDMAVFLTLFQIVTYGWSVLLLLIGLYLMNQLTFGRTLLNVLLTLVAAAAILCLLVLLFSLLQQLYTFGLTLLNEIMFRM